LDPKLPIVLKHCIGKYTVVLTTLHYDIIH